MADDSAPLTQLAGPHREGTLPLRTLTLAPNESTALHRHDCSEYVYVTSGSAVATRGRAEAELEPTASAYFPSGEYHQLKAGAHGATILTCHVLAHGQSDLGTVDYTGQLPDPGWPNPNVIKGEDLGFRWALLEEFEPWVPVEPTKGNRIQIRYLFTPDRGSPDAVAGIALIDPHTHYTLHHHEPAEVYYVLEGSGVIHISGEAQQVTAGRTVHVPANAVHGIDTEHSSMRLLWLYNLVDVGSNWTWRAVEPIWDKPKPPCCYGGKP